MKAQLHVWNMYCKQSIYIFIKESILQQVMLNSRSWKYLWVMFNSMSWNHSVRKLKSSLQNKTRIIDLVRCIYLKSSTINIPITTQLAHEKNPGKWLSKQSHFSNRFTHRGQAWIRLFRQKNHEVLISLETLWHPFYNWQKLYK